MNKVIAVIFIGTSLFSTVEAQALVCKTKAKQTVKALNSTDRSVPTSLMDTSAKSEYQDIDMTMRTIETYTFGIELKLVLISLDATDSCKLHSVKIEQYD